MPREAQKLGRRIGSMERRLSELERGAGPVEAGVNLLLNDSNTLELKLKTDRIKFNLYSDAFVLDHSTQGELDSNSLKLDKGYKDGEIVQDNISKTLLQTANNEALMSGDGTLIEP